MSGAAEVLDQRMDQFGKRERRRRPPAGQAVAFVPEEVLMEPHLPPAAGPEAVQWRASALAAIHALQAHGYLLLLTAMPGEPGSRSAGFHRGLLQRLAGEADVHPGGILPYVQAEALPGQLRQAAAAQGLDLRRAWFLSWDEALGTASRRVGCRSVRLLEPGRQARRRWPLLRGHVPMKLMDAVAFILRFDGHLAPGQPLDVDAAPPGRDSGARSGGISGAGAVRA